MHGKYRMQKNKRLCPYTDMKEFSVLETLLMKTNDKNTYSVDVDSELNGFAVKNSLSLRLWTKIWVTFQCDINNKLAYPDLY